MLTRSDIIQYGTKEQILLPLNDLIDKYGLKLRLFELRPQHRALLQSDGENIIFSFYRMLSLYVLSKIMV